MANRFPLTLDGTTIKELPSGDNLDLTGSSISISGSQGTDGQVLTSTGSGIAWEDAASGGGGSSIWNVISSQTVTSSVTSVTFSNCFTSTYDAYELHLTGVLGNGFNQIKYLNGSTELSTYEQLLVRFIGSSSPSHYFDTGFNYIYAYGNSGRSLNARYKINQPLDATYNSVIGEMHTTSSGSNLMYVTAVARNTTGTAGNGLIIKGGNNITAGTFTLYGLSTSQDHKTMANRFPLIVDSSGVAALKELPSGDNLDLTGNGIVGAGTVALTNLTVGGSQGTDGQVLTSTGSGIAWEDAAGGGGGAWSVISSQTVSSSVAYVTFTGVTGYENYKIVWNDAVHTDHPTRFYFQASTDNGSNWYSTNSWKSVVISGDSSTSSTTKI